MQFSLDYQTLITNTAGLPNTLFFAQMICAKNSALPLGLGLSAHEYQMLLQRHFPNTVWPSCNIDTDEDKRVDERNDVFNLLLEHSVGNDISERWVAIIVAHACMGNDHLWQDLGLISRDMLSQLMTQNFPSLAAKNVFDMKWKKFLYKQLCDKTGVNVCRSPSCEYCTDYLNCFGPED